jgi:murein DD-endopeptidase MepM/ murein hydrolase activator NlpD
MTALRPLLAVSVPNRPRSRLALDETAVERASRPLAGRMPAPLGFFLAMVFLSGCVIRDLPPDTDNGVPETPAVAAPAEAPAPPPPFETPAGTVTVKPGQTLYGIARAAEVPALALIDANHLQPPYRLAIGRVLTIPPLRQHAVQNGETLYGVAHEYGVEASALAEANHLTPPYNVKTGTVLILPPAAVAPAPGTRPGQPAVAAALPPASVAPPAMAPVPLHSSAAPASGGISVAPLPPPSSAKPVSAIPPLANPPGTPSASVTSTPPPAAPQVATTAPTPLVPKVKRAPSVPAPAPENNAKPDEAPAPSADIAQLVASHKPPEPPLFLWPVHGRLLSVFGDSKAGGHNDGINIAAPEGTTVSAAENGTVAYAGNELRGFGNLLLIKHPDGWVTAYAHNQVLLVKKGQKVRRGQPIARVGSSGGVTPAQLHFELRRGTQAIDPLDHLPPEAGSAG